MPVKTYGEKPERNWRYRGHRYTTGSLAREVTRPAEVNLMDVVRSMKIKVVVKGQREASIRIKLGILLVQLAASVMRCRYTMEIQDAAQE